MTRMGLVRLCAIGLIYWLALFGTTTSIDSRAAMLGVVLAGLPVALLLLLLARRDAVRYAAAIAYKDQLTGLPNRAYFTDVLDGALARSKRHGKLVAVLFLDLDRFKLLNDTMGHNSGDQLLIEVSKRLKRQVRSGETISRIGGDEFAVVLEHLKDDSAPEIMAKRVITSLEKPFSIGGHEVVVATSIGIALNQDPNTPPEELIRRADVALYDAKGSGRGCWKVYQPEKAPRAVERLEMNADLRNAIQQQELRLHFQPEINLTTGMVEGFEALVRWQHPSRGLLSPAAFIATAEEEGFISSIGRWVLKEACREAVGWGVAFPELPPMHVSVNLSPLEFRQRELVTEVSKVLDEVGLEPHLLKLEIVETALMTDAEATMTTLHGLRQLGVKLAIDDFGTGYSSLSYLRQFPVDTLKIDQSFVREATRDHDVNAIIVAIVSLAHSLGIDVTAEGVETREQLAFLIKCNCDRAQGYLFARPLPQEALANFLRTKGDNAPPVPLRPVGTPYFQAAA